MTKTVEVEEKGQKELEFLQYKLNKTIKLQKIYLQKVANPNVQNKKLLLPLKISKELKNLDDKPKKENFLRKNKLVFRLKKTD